ncbi:hypothetical protein DU504_04845 [Haloplanus salinus]|jgi:hypothetical protein|uniref:Uncharacterized protein n=1 Tax=Haloplanus salinus TaxID=1126245 RepID=A0A368N7Y7_9EURY|nr:hypothetical protein [Haloplanus salinus]RCU46687.1 hypothetical protein DU504_04845 [Haloplanus salinus]
MADARRDGALACLTLVALVVVGGRTVGVGVFLDPLAVAVGVAGTLGIEWAFLASPALATGWERRGVPLASAAAVVLVAVVLAPRAPWLVGAAAWGLVTYGGLLGCVLVGWGNPVARVSTGRGR